MRLGHLGPAGTFTEEAARAAAADAGGELVPYPSVRETVEAVLAGEVDAALVPIENSLEGTVTATVDALSAEERLRMVGEAVRSLDGPGVAAIASRGAAELHGGVVLREGIEDEEGNATRFAWLALEGARPLPAAAAGTPWKTSILFAGAGDARPGWLVRCLSELASRGVNLVKIESRPARRQLGHYLFLADCEGREDDAAVTDAVAALRAHCDRVRVLGSYPAAPNPSVS